MWLLLLACVQLVRAVQYRVTFKRVSAFAKPGTAVRGEVDDAACPYRFDLYAGGRSRKAGERERSSVYVSTDTAVDATFTLRLLGASTAGKTPVVEADGGCRFTKQNRESKGVPFVTPELLPRFVDEDGAVCCEAEIVEWPATSAVAWPDTLPAPDVRPKRELHAGATFVPIWRDLTQRANLGDKGCYGGVDYLVERVSVDGEDAFEAVPGATLLVRPAYPLIGRVERAWPIEVCEDEIPVALSSTDYTVLTGFSSAGIAAAWLAIAGFLATQVGGLVEVPSLSMAPSIEPGDTLVVERVTPRFRSPAVGEVVVFDAPAALKRVSGNSQAQLYVKRVAAIAGDRIRVDDDGAVTVNGASRQSPAGDRACDLPEARAELKRVLGDARRSKIAVAELTVPRGSVYVLGDCADVSVDSRVWGPLRTSDVRARPMNTLKGRR